MSASNGRTVWKWKHWTNPEWFRQQDEWNRRALERPGPVEVGVWPVATIKRLFVHCAKVVLVALGASAVAWGLFGFWKWLVAP